MKKAILTIFVITLFAKLSAQTTLEEYNYITKGYRVQIESGLDMKKGYEIKDVNRADQKNSNGAVVREAFLKVLNRVSESGVRTIAAYLIEYVKTGNPRQYLCIPSPNSSQQLMDAYFNSLPTSDIFDNSSQKIQVIAFLLSKSLKWQ